MKTPDNFKPGLEGRFTGTINGREYKAIAETVYDEELPNFDIRWGLTVDGQDTTDCGGGYLEYDESFGPLVTTADLERFAAELAEEHDAEIERLHQEEMAHRNAEIEAAESLNELRRLLHDEWYDSVEGCYGSVPTWGEETERVQARINSSCEDGGIVSWDTRSAVPTEHRYIFRRHTLGSAAKHEFYIQTEAEIQEGE